MIRLSVPITLLLAFGVSCTASDDTGDTDEPENTCISVASTLPEEDFFADISTSSGIQEDNYDGTQMLPINDHSRLAFAELNGDGYPDIVMHSLFPNPQNGIPFEHLVFENQQDGTFKNVSDRSGLRDVQAGFFAFADVDNDGDQDVFAGLDYALTGVQHQLLLNDGSGAFSPLTNSGVSSLPPGIANAAFADLNGDTFVDLFLGFGGSLYQQQDMLLFGNGDGTFSDASSRLKNRPRQPSNGTVMCDYDNDGDLDIFVSTYGISVSRGVNTLWENQGDSFENVALEQGFASLGTGNPLGSTSGDGSLEPGASPQTYTGSNGFGIDCGDFDNDGDLDIVFAAIAHPDSGRQWADPSQILINQGEDGNWAFISERDARALPFNEGDVDAALVDFDNDGRLDMSLSRDKKYEKNYSDLEQQAWFGLMHQQPDGRVANLGPVSGLNAIDAVISASLATCSSNEDCSVDGEACLPTDSATPKCRTECSSNADCPEPHEICHAKGFCKLELQMKNAQNHAWADIDRDGDSDLLVGGRDTGGGRPNFLYRNDIGHLNGWVGFDVLGDGQSISTDAFGTRIRIEYPEERLIREKKSSRGMYNSEDGRSLLFGLGERDCDATIHIEWPDGTTHTVEPTEWTSGQYYQVVYPNLVTVIQ